MLRKRRCLLSLGFPGHPRVYGLGFAALSTLPRDVGIIGHLG
jgi:hypothetical protein